MHIQKIDVNAPLGFGSEAYSELPDCVNLTQMSSFHPSYSSLPNRVANIIQQIPKWGQKKGPWWLFSESWKEFKQVSF